MVEEAATWHYAVAFALFLVLGAVGHVTRAVFNMFPDRLSDNDTMDMLVSDGYGWNDKLLGTEYDDGGFYRLDSYRNVRNACLMSGFGGLAVMVFSDGASIAIAQGIDAALAWLWGLFLHRLGTVTVF
ncbi:hypothetical protein LXM94_12160 [Rhizobium sp. TRM95111]|uniref:hypothetical protein n=1 Tax=Rhizobium alarense TaxID=2846851 RepID=UPI001F47DECF|nr:hypothetical protein [Rhizobium alarense]MCF3640720.1 hypothetical protein [Rhizobium alarense]